MTHRDRHSDLDRPRVVVLCGGSSGARYVLGQLGNVADVCAIVHERLTRWQRLRMLMRRARRIGWWHPVDRVLLAVYSRLVLWRQAASCPEVVEVRGSRGADYDCPRLDVGSINESEVVQLLRAYQPDLVVVLGTSIIRKPVLDSAPLFVNLHAGITPLYRGAHGCFWAAFQGDFDNIGVTLHVVDTGIDTGAILRQTRIRFDQHRDNFVTLAAKANVAGSETIQGWIRDNAHNLAGATRAAAPSGPSRLYFSPGLRDYLRFELANRSGAESKTPKAA